MRVGLLRRPQHRRHRPHGGDAVGVVHEAAFEPAQTALRRGGRELVIPIADEDGIRAVEQPVHAEA